MVVDPTEALSLNGIYTHQIRDILFGNDVDSGPLVASNEKHLTFLQPFLDIATTTD